MGAYLIFAAMCSNVLSTTTPMFRNGKMKSRNRRKSNFTPKAKFKKAKRRMARRSRQVNNNKNK